MLLDVVCQHLLLGGQVAANLGYYLFDIGDHGLDLCPFF
jgi:hypothetical protein